MKSQTVSPEKIKEIIENIPIDEPANDDIKSTEDDGITGAIVPDGDEELTGSAFTEWWCFDFWILVSSSGGVVGKDLSILETTEEERPLAMQAGDKLEKLTHKYPKMLGWMRHPMIDAGADFMAVAMFFGGKGMKLMAKPHIIEGEKAND